MVQIRAQLGQKETLTEEVGSVTVPLNLLASEQAARGKFADQAFNVSVGLLRLQETEQTDSAQIEYGSEYRDFKLELETDTEYTGHGAKFDAWYEKTSGDILGKVSNARARRKVELFLKLHKNRDGLLVETRAWDSHKKEIEQGIGDKIDSHIANILSKDDPTTVMLDTIGVEYDEAVLEMSQYLDGLHEAGLLDGAGREKWKRESAKRLEDAQEKYNTELAEQFINNQVLAIAQLEGWDAALDWIDDPATLKKLSTDLNMSIEDLTSLTNAIKGKAQRSQSDETIEKARERETQGDSFVKRLDGIARGTIQGDSFNDLLDDVMASSLTPTGENSKDSWRTKINAASEAANKEQKTPFDITDPVKYKELRTKIEDDPANKAMIDTLREAWGKGKKGGISTDAYETLFSMVDDPESPLNDTVVTGTTKSLDNLRGIRVGQIKADEALDESEVIAKVLKADQKALRLQLEMDRYDQTIKDDPDFLKKHQAYFDFIMRPAIEEVTLDMFDNLLRRSARFLGGPVGRFIPLKEEEALVEKKFKRLQEEDVFETLTDQEQEEARQAFVNGFSVQDIVDELTRPEE